MGDLVLSFIPGLIVAAFWFAGIAPSYEMAATMAFLIALQGLQLFCAGRLIKSQRGLIDAQRELLDMQED